MRVLKTIVPLLLIGLLSACVTVDVHDYAPFREADPHSIIVLPPINHSTEIIAPYSVSAQLVTPISEAGYYTFPVGLVAQTFRNNGMTVAEDVHAIPHHKLHEIFGADAALYVTIEEYGTSYYVISSETAVTMNARLIDLRTGKLLWQDSARASSAESQGSSSGGLVGMLVEAAVTQILETVVDTGFDIAGISSNRLVSAELQNGFLYGPRSPNYGQLAKGEKKAAKQ